MAQLFPRTAQTPIGWAAPSRGLYFYSQLQPGASDLVLERQPHKLSLVLAKSLSETSRPFWTYCAAPLLDVTEV